MWNCRKQSSRPSRTDTRPRATSARSALATSTGSPPRSIRTARPSHSSARPNLRSSGTEPLHDHPIQRTSTMSTIEITGPEGHRFDEILTPEAVAFLAALHERFAGRRHDRLAARMQLRYDLGNGRNLKFPDETAHIRADSEWRVAGAGPGLEDRRVEITGPTDPKMTINALNSGANVWLADQEDATSPTWGNVIGGQLTLLDAIRGRLAFVGHDGKEYAVTAAETPTIVMRPRGWHLAEKHIRFTDRSGLTTPASGSLVDFGLYLFHNAAAL